MDVREETHLVNQLKEDVAYVSSDFRRDLELVGMHGSSAAAAHRKASSSSSSSRTSTSTSGERDKIVVDYVLPDYTTRFRGEMRPHDSRAKPAAQATVGGAGAGKEYVMELGNERFAAAELLFRPGDVGMKQAGIPETVMQSLSGLPPGLWPAMLANIVVVGGNSLLKGFVERLYGFATFLFPPSPALLVKEWRAHAKILGG